MANPDGFISGGLTGATGLGLGLGMVQTPSSTESSLLPTSTGELDSYLVCEREFQRNEQTNYNSIFNLSFKHTVHVFT